MIFYILTDLLYKTMDTFTLGKRGTLWKFGSPPLGNDHRKMTTQQLSFGQAQSAIRTITHTHPAGHSDHHHKQTQSHLLWPLQYGLIQLIPEDSNKKIKQEKVLFSSPPLRCERFRAGQITNKYGSEYEVKKWREPIRKVERETTYFG